MLSSSKYLLSPPYLYRSMSLLTNQAYINGKWLPSISGETFPVKNPADQSIITHVPDMTIEDTLHAIESAKKAFSTFKKTTAKERSDLLRNWYNLLLKNTEELAQILTKENGKSLAESHGEIKYGNSFVEWFSEESRRINGEILQSPLKNRRLMLLKQPVGVAALITPWNFPHAMITRKVGAAIAAGCTCIIKPSEETPLTALALIKLAEDAGFPNGVLNVVTTSPKNSAIVGKLLCEHDDVRALSFTGSTQVGKILYKQCSSTVKRLSLELGGNAPFIVFDNSNVDLAIQSAMICKFRNTGQTCVSANRFYVHENVFDEFMEKFLRKVKEEIRMGDGSKQGITHGPLIKVSQVEAVERLVEDAVRKGAKMHCGGKRLREIGELFYDATVLSNVDESMEIFGKEIFGPVAVVHRFCEEEEVLRMANSVPVGLAGYFFSNDLSQIFRVAGILEVGMIGVNEGLISCTEGAFGGVKESGIGREGSSHGVEDFLDIKYLCIGNIRE